MSDKIEQEQFNSEIEQILYDHLTGGPSTVVPTSRVGSLLQQLIEKSSSSGEVDVDALDGLLGTLLDQAGNTLKQTVSDKSIQVNDVSPIEHTVKVQLRQKNLLDTVAYPIETQTIGGVTITNNGDGSYTLSGENTTGYIIDFKSASIPESERVTLAPGRYSASRGIWVLTEKTDPSDSGSGVIWGGNSTNYMIGPFRIYSWRISVNPDNTVRYSHGRYGSSELKLPCTIYPQIEVGDEPTEYSPYVDLSTVTVTRYGVDETDNPKNYTPEPDGTVNGITSLSPTMTLSTDNESVTIEAEYNLDTACVIESIEQEIKALEETLSTHDETLSEHEKEISANYSSLSSRITNNQNKISSIDGEIADISSRLDKVGGGIVNVAELPTELSFTSLRSLYRVNKTEGTLLMPGDTTTEMPASIRFCDVLPTVGEPSVFEGDAPVINAYVHLVEGVNYAYSTDYGWASMGSITDILMVRSRDEIPETLTSPCFIMGETTSKIYAVRSIVGAEDEMFVELTTSENIDDLEGALDSIIEIQNGLIGGES